MKVLYQHFQTHIVNEDANYHQQEITEQLYPSVQVGVMENDIAHEEETCWEAYGKRHDESHDIRAYHKRTPNKVLFM